MAASGVTITAPAFTFYVDVVAAAQACGISPWTLRKWISQGKILSKHGLRRLGTRTLFDLPVLQSSIARGDLS